MEESMHSVRERALEALRRYYGYSSFRPGQEELILQILSRRDALAVMPTGAGKSLCYQIPALVFPGITLVVSPLISLMRDQVQALNQAGIRAAYLNSSLTARQFFLALRNARAGMYKVIYVAPERLLTEDFLEFAQAAPISLLAVDEAHCISQWGHDFRPSYTRIAEFAEHLPRRPVMAAFTATATERVRKDILRQLGLRNPFQTVMGFDRPNLFFAVETPRDKTAFVRRYILEHKEASGIVYCGTRKAVDELCRELEASGIQALPYHAGLPDEERHRNQEEFQFDRCLVMVATNAFGMGIDKSNVSYILHYNMPMNLESYYQEAGRAGRDGSPAECILLYAPSDVRLCRFLAEKNLEQSETDSPEEQDRRLRQEMEKIRRMARYAEQSGCLRRDLLQYFGEEAPLVCGNCGSCRALQSAAGEEFQRDARMVASLIRKTGQRYGLTRIGELLAGERTPRVEELGLQRLPEFGAMEGLSRQAVRSLLETLLAQGYIWRTEEEYPRLRLTEKSRALLHQPEEGGRLPAGKEAELFRRLKEKRKEWARRLGVPPYTVYSDRTLREMIRLLPAGEREFLEVPGSTSAKLERFGMEFLELIREYAEV